MGSSPLYMCVCYVCRQLNSSSVEETFDRAPTANDRGWWQCLLTPTSLSIWTQQSKAVHSRTEFSSRVRGIDITHFPALTLQGLLHHFSVEIYTQICQIRHIIEWNTDLLFRWGLCCRSSLYPALLLLSLQYSNTSFVNLLHSHGSCCHFGRCSWLQVNWFLVDWWFQ